MGFGGLGYPWKGHRLYFLSTLSAWEAWCTMLLLLVLALYPSISGSSGTPFSHLSNSFLNSSVSIPVLFLISPDMALKSLIILRAGLLCIIVEFSLFLLRFILVSFIVLYLAFSLVSNPIIFFPSSSICCHALIIIYRSLLLSNLHRFRHFSLW